MGSLLRARRVSGSVFMRNYFNPALIGDLKDRVLKGIARLKALDYARK